jgi:hypothetical protein
MAKGIKVKVGERDRGFVDLMKQLKKASKGMSVKVGVLDNGKGAEVREGGLTNTEVMALNEFGSEGGLIPERAPIRRTIDAQQSTYMADFLPRLARAAFERRITFTQAMGLFGERVSADIKNTITQGRQLEPNKQSTIDKKGSDRPLVDTGRLVQSITYEVQSEKGGAP